MASGMGTICWVTDGQLARSSRPGYRPAGGVTSKEDITAWVAEARGLRINSIICLLDEHQLDWYVPLDLHPDGLLGYYRQHGFQVCHIPVPDYRKPAVPAAELAKALTAFDKLRKPVLVHCSAGVDRTGAVITHILQSRPVA